MSADRQVLIDEISRLTNVLASIEARLGRFLDDELPDLGRTDVAASYVAQLIDNTYTAVETLFLRISQFFENSLTSDRWHADLLDKMTLHVAGIRERVIEDATRRDLHELLRFRHFKRYYFELEFDWKKLDYLLEVHRRMMPLLKADIDRFTLFLHRLGEDT